MRKTAIGLIAVAGALLAATTAASAQTFVDSTVYYGNSAPGVTLIRQCDDSRCWDERRPDLAWADGSYSSRRYYAPAPTYYWPYYGSRHYRYTDPAPGFYVRTLAFSFGFGGW